MMQSDGYVIPVTTRLLGIGAGITPSLSFDPGQSNLNETYEVTVRNILRTADGFRTSYSYWVNFFDAETP